jgi:hypothetical protein
MTCWPVSARVGDVRNNDASHIEPWRPVRDACRDARARLATICHLFDWLVAARLCRSTWLRTRALARSDVRANAVDRSRLSLPKLIAVVAYRHLGSAGVG